MENKYYLCMMLSIIFLIAALQVEPTKLLDSVNQYLAK